MGEVGRVAFDHEDSAAGRDSKLFSVRFRVLAEVLSLSSPLGPGEID